jgi:hypothetical protein
MMDSIHPGLADPVAGWRLDLADLPPDSTSLLCAPRLEASGACPSCAGVLRPERFQSTIRAVCGRSLCPHSHTSILIAIKRTLEWLPHCCRDLARERRVVMMATKMTNAEPEATLAKRESNLF